MATVGSGSEAALCVGLEGTNTYLWLTVISSDFPNLGYSENDTVTSFGYLSVIRQMNSIQLPSTSEAVLDVRGQ